MICYAIKLCFKKHLTNYNLCYNDSTKAGSSSFSGYQMKHIMAHKATESQKSDHICDSTVSYNLSFLKGLYKRHIFCKADLVKAFNQ